MKDLRHYLNRAQKEGWAIGQFNFSDLNQMRAIVGAAEKLKSPIILGTSEGESKFFGLDEAVALRNILIRQNGLPIFLNLDHGKSFEYIKQAVDAGYDMVHFDGSKLSLEENIKITKEVKKYARGPLGWRSVLAEGEVGKISFEAKEEYLTNLDEAQKYLKQTKVDLLAVSIGNFHGSGAQKQESKLRTDILGEIRKISDKCFLVLHGGSGIDELDIKKAIELGIVKININTELRLAFAVGLKESLEGLDEITPYKFLPQAQERVEKVVESKINLFGSANRM